jgi:hypothetical protein
MIISVIVPQGLVWIKTSAFTMAGMRCMFAPNENEVVTNDDGNHLKE